MLCPAVYPPDPTLGIADPQMLPAPKVVPRSRNYPHRPCPECGRSCPRERVRTRTLHDLGDPLGGRPRDIRLTYSQHYCTRCHRFFSADMADWAAPRARYTHRVVVEDLVTQPLEAAVVDDRQDAEGAVIQLVRGDVSREAVEGPIEVVGPDPVGRLFSPRPPPSSGWWRKGRRRDGRARGANWQPDRVSRPRRPTERPGPRPDGCSGPWARPGRTYRR